MGHWQQNLSAFVNIKPYANEEDLLPQLQNQTIPMCVFPIRASGNYVNEYLEKYGINYNGAKLADIQTKLLKDNTIIPLAFENTNIVYNNDLRSVFAESKNGYIDFSYIQKKD